jgi:hypothetical protein
LPRAGPSGSNTSLEEEDDDDGYGTPAGAPDSTATVRRRRYDGDDRRI